MDKNSKRSAIFDILYVIRVYTNRHSLGGKPAGTSPLEPAL